MKRTLAGLALLLCCALVARAALVSSNMVTFGSTGATGSTNTSAVVTAGIIYLPATTFTFQHAGLTNFPQLAIDIQGGLGTNPATHSVIQTYTASYTNDGIDSVTITNGGSVPFYFSLVVRATNGLSVGAQAILQH